MKFYACKFYITFRCNSQCIYCDIWQNPKYKKVADRPPDQVKKVIYQLYQNGVRYIDFTGGEPALYPGIEEVLAYTKSLGILIEFTTNGLAFEKSMPHILPYVDYMNLSLDTLKKDQYAKTRGVDQLDKVLNTIQLILAEHKKLKIIAVISEQNMAELDQLLAFAQKNQTTIYFSPLFTYFEKIRSQFNEKNYQTHKIARLFYQPYSLVYLHFMKFYAAARADDYPACAANKKILTLNPAGEIILPCYHYHEQTMGWQNEMKEVFNSKKFEAYSNQAGKLACCKGCTTIPYMGVSLSYSFNRLFFYQAFSEEYVKFKDYFLNRYSSHLDLEPDFLYQKYLELDQVIEEQLDFPASNDLFYAIEFKNKQIYHALFKYPLTIAQYMQDMLNEYCWDIEYSPHIVIRYFYQKIIPHLDFFFKNGLIKKEHYFPVLKDLPLFHINWWLFFIAQYYRLKDDQKLKISPLTTWIENYLSLILAILPDHALSLEINAYLFSIGFMLATDNQFCRLKNKTISLDQERLTYRYLLLQQEVHPAAKMRPFFSPDFQKIVENGAAGPLEENLGLPIKKDCLAGQAQLQDWIEKNISGGQPFHCYLDQIHTLNPEQINEAIKKIKKEFNQEQLDSMIKLLKQYEFRNWALCAQKILN